jgi:MYXO-CTERM domain-containing protein
MHRLFAAAIVLAVSAPAAAERVKVFVFAGQSNMVGYGDGASLPPELASQPSIWYDHYNPTAREGWADYANATSADWEPLAPMGTVQRHGPEITFGRDVAAALPGERIAIVKMSLEGTNIVEHWARGVPPDPEGLTYKSQLYHALMGTLDSAAYGEATGNPLAYPDEVTRLDAALARLAEDGHDVEIAALVWMQGENEAGWSAAFTYGDTLADLVAALREDLDAPGMAVLIGRVSDNLYAENGGPIPADRSENVTAVREAQVAFAATDPRARWIDTDDFAPRSADDHWHFDPAAYLVMGERFAAAYLDLAASTPPVDGGGPADPDGGAGGGGATGDDGGCSCRVSGARGGGGGAAAIGAVALALLAVLGGGRSRRRPPERPAATESAIHASEPTRRSDPDSSRSGRARGTRGRAGGPADRS